MRSVNVVLIVTVSLILQEAKCGVIDSVYGRVANTTQAVKDDIHSWWSYGLDIVAGSDDDHHGNKSTNDPEKDSGMIAGIYNKFKGGVSYGYMTVHDVVLGKDSDPNKGIIRSLYERALKRLSQVKTYIFGDNNAIDQKGSQEKEEKVKEQVLKVLFGNETDLFTDENEKKALESLRNKLTKAGDDALHLVDNEKEIIRKAYESVRNKADELNSNTKTTADDIKNKLQENIGKTQEFIEDASKKVNDSAQNLGEDLKKSVNDMEKNVQGE